MEILIVVILIYAWLIYEMHTAPFMDEVEETEEESDDEAIF